LGYFPKGVLDVLTQALGGKKAAAIAAEINEAVTTALFEIDEARTNEIKRIINDTGDGKDPEWAPP